MQINRARFQTGQAKAGNPAHHAGQIGFDQGSRQAEHFEIAAAAIGGDDRNPHFGDDLQQAAIERQLEMFGAAAGLAVLTGPVTIGGDGLEGQIGINRRGAEPDQHCCVMRIETFGRTDIERTGIAQPIARQA